MKFVILTTEGNRGGSTRVGIRINADIELPILYPNKLRLLLELPKIRKIFKECDIIHALDGWPYGVIAALASLGLKKKLIITAIGTGAVQPLYHNFKKFFLTWAYRKTNEFTAVSNNTRREIQKIIPDLKVSVINHGVDLARIQNVHAGYQKEIEQYKPYILSVGTLKKRKGFAYAIDAFAGIANRFMSLRYVIVGGGPEHRVLLSKIEHLGLRNRVQFLSNIPHEYLSALYQNAEAFMLLSQDDGKDLEGFGLVFLEAAACGLPVVASKDTSAEDAMIDGKTGFLVPQKNPAAAAEMLAFILADRKIKESFSKEAIRFANSMTWEKAARNYADLYKTIS